MKITNYLPEEVNYCKICTYSNQRPSSTVEFKSKKNDKKELIKFKDGICDACHFAEIKNNEIDWSKREEELHKLCDAHRSKDGSYDCVIPGSGGKDSFYASHILKNKFGMHPITVTWAPHLYTDIGLQNFNSWIESGFDNILFSPNRNVHRLLTKLAFENLLHPFQPFIIGQKQVAPKIANQYGISLIFYGDNPAEHGNNIEENFNPKMKREFYSGEKNLENLSLSGYSGKELIESFNLNINDLEPYFPISLNDVKKNEIEVHYLSYYLKWDPQECYYYSIENSNFRPSPERTEGSYSKYSSIDDKIDCLHYYTTFIKFGIGRATYDTSQEIRNGKITREEAIPLIKNYDGERPKKYLKECLEYMSIDEDDFNRIIDKFRPKHLWKKSNQNLWELKSPIWKSN